MLLGRGSQAYEKASHLLLSFQAVNTLPNVQIVTQQSSPLTPNSSMLTLTQFYNTPLWSLNPCRIVSFVRSNRFIRPGTPADPIKHTTNQSIPKSGVPTRGMYSEVVFATLEGHLIAGEEAMRVYTVRKSADSTQFPFNIISRVSTSLGIPRVGSRDKVYFEVASYSKGSGLLGRMCMPLIRPLQRRFLTDCCNVMCSAVKSTL